MTGPIRLDEIATVMAEYDPEQRWNGWLCPRIDALSVENVLTALNLSYGEDAWTYGIYWHWMEDGSLQIIERTWMHEDGPNYDGEIIPPNADGLYSLGSFSWTWSAADDPELCWVCGLPNDGGDEPGYGSLDDGNGPTVPLCSERCTKTFYEETNA